MYKLYNIIADILSLALSDCYILNWTPHPTEEGLGLKRLLIYITDFLGLFYLFTINNL